MQSTAKVTLLVPFHARFGDFCPGSAELIEQLDNNVTILMLG